MPAYTNATQVISALFREIVMNQAEQAALKAEPVLDFLRLRSLRTEMQDFRRAAEKRLAWNTDKGNVQ